MLIAENLRQLRVAKGVTQEELACALGVTGQAVSKWERDECYPDITLLPGLANYFGVSVDKLIGMDEISNANKLNEIHGKANVLYGARKYREAIELLETALKTFPNDAGLMNCLAFSLALEEGVSGRAIQLCERAIAEASDDKLRATAIAGLCFLYKMNGETEKAAKLALLRPHCREAMELLYPKFLDRPTREAYLREHLPDMLIDMYLMIKGDLATDNDYLHSIFAGRHTDVSVEAAIRAIHNFLVS